MRRVDGVEQAAGGIFSTIRFVDEEGEQLSSAFAPEFVSSVAPEPFETLTYTDGRPPETADEASIDESTADREDFAIGDTLHIAGPAGVRGYEIVGLQRLGSTSSGGSSTAQLTLEEAQRLTNKQGQFDAISVEAADGVSPDELGQTVVMVTHDPEAASYADRLIVLRDGLVVHDGAAGTADDVIELMKEVA